MPKTSPTEWLLARVTGSDRAVAIMGDLTEMAATRGRLWFWMAYARTLVALGWRTAPAAFLLALAGKRFIVRAILPFDVGHRVSHLADAGLFGPYNPHIRLITWNLTMVLARWLIFALPFVLIRFGLRNRLAQLTCALFLFAAPVYILRPWIMDLSSLLIAATVAAASISSLWRRPMIVLAATSIAAIATTISGLYLLGLVFHHNFLWLTAFDVAIYDAIGLALAVIFCLYLSRLLLANPNTPDRTVA
jgi:hypothetical protein